MSWLAEEWKEKLPPDALNNIQSMEKNLEKLQKDVAQYSCKTDSLEITNNKQKQQLDENLKELQRLEREKCEYQKKYEEEEEKYQNLLAMVKNKDVMIQELNEKNFIFKEKIHFQETEISKLQKELDDLMAKYGKDFQLVEEGTMKFNEAHTISKQRVQELQLQLDESKKERRELEISYENKIQELIKEEIRMNGATEIFSKKVASLQLQNQALYSQNQNLEEKLEELHRNANSNSEQTQVENKLRQLIRSREEEIKELKEKLTTETSIGTYLGIDVKKMCSDSSLTETDPSQLMACNHTLQDEVNRLTKRIEMHEKPHMVRHMLHDDGDNIDSGVALRHNTITCVESNSGNEILMSRVEQVCSKSNLYSDEKSSADDDMLIKLKYLHLTEELFENKSLLKSYEEENDRIKKEVHQMKDVYESHMRICTNQNKLTRKCSEKLTTGNEMTTIEYLKNRLDKEEKMQQELRNSLHEQQKKCLGLEEKLTANGNVSSAAVYKLEELVDVILQQRNFNFNSNNSLPSSIENILSQLSDTIVSLHEEINDSREGVLENIRCSTDRILCSLQQHRISNSKQGDQSNCENNKPTKVSFNTGGNEYYLAPSGGSIEELENIKQKLSCVQQSIYDYGGEYRRLEDERNHMQEELIKMVDLVKRKDEEIGQLSCQYEQEKLKVDENEACYYREMDDLKKEQLHIFEEYRDMCDLLKKKEIELLNKTKQMKINMAEYREKEDALNEMLLTLQQDNDGLEDKISYLKKDLDEKNGECDMLIARLTNSENQVRTVFDNLSRIEDVLYKSKAEGLYK